MVKFKFSSTVYLFGFWFLMQETQVLGSTWPNGIPVSYFNRPCTAASARASVWLLPLLLQIFSPVPFFEASFDFRQCHSFCCPSLSLCYIMFLYSRELNGD